VDEADELYARLEEFLRRVFALIEGDAVGRLLDLDVSFSQARTIFVLAHVAEPVPISEIARRLGLSQAAAGRNVEQLVTLGIVERRESPDDRRVKLVYLSPSGLEIADQHHEHKRQALKEITGRLAVEDRRRLSAALGPILAGDCLSSSTHTSCINTATKEHVHGHR